MCGIGGILLQNNTPAPASFQTSLDTICDSLTPRGPDGNGTYTKTTATHTIGLVHTRLSIIDLGTGAQPMSDHKNRTIVFNGEIYNFIELREQLSATYTFKTQSDTEVILALYDQYGDNCAQHLRGMYSFAIHDPDQDRLIISRDPFGIKPLYIKQDNKRLIFASEPKAIQALAQNERSKPNNKYLHDILKKQHGFGANTHDPDITRIAPGTTLTFEKGKLTNTQHRSFLNKTAPNKTSEQTALEDLDKILQTSTELHCRSDVGYGLFLSGGVDSNAILHCLSRMQNQPKLHTYTAWFDIPQAKDEREISRATAQKCNAEHHEVLFGEEDFFNLLPQITAYMSDPVADYATLPTWKLASYAAQNQKVILSGEGGDELFAGYGRYRPNIWKTITGKNKLDRLHAPWNDNKKSLGHMSQKWTRLQQRQAKDIAHWLPNNLLIKLDNCLMAHALEGRTPFLDEEVANFAFSLPDTLKIKGKTGKHVLKTWLNTHLPESQPFRKKSGFTVPVGHWIAKREKDLWPLLSSQPFIQSLLTKDEIESYSQAIKSPQTAIKVWPLLYLALWYKSHYENASIGDVFETLGN